MADRHTSVRRSFCVFACAVACSVAVAACASSSSPPTAAEVAAVVPGHANRDGVFAPLNPALCSAAAPCIDTPK